MTISRRDFLRATGLALGTAALPTWAYSARPGGLPGSAVDKDLIADAVLGEAKRLGSSYADLRINKYRIESVGTRERQVRFVSRGEDVGFGVRVLVDGTWGFSSSPDVNPAEALRVTRDAVAVAKANAKFNEKKIELASQPKATGTWKSSFKIDPFDVPVDKKIEFLMNVNESALSVKGVGFVNSSMAWVNEQKYLATSDGTKVEQYLIRGVPSFSVTAIDRTRGDFQARNSLAQGQSAGWEYTTEHDWIAEARKAGEEAVMKLSAKPVEPGKYDLVLDPSHLFLTIHESVGHSTELDRALLWEANYAGTSFLTPDKRGSLKLGSEMVNFVADRTQPGGLASTGWDDEGVPGQEWDLVKDGTFVGWQTTRDLAPLVGDKRSNGCLYADSWNSVPFARMPNVSLKPSSGQTSAADLIADVKKGVMIFGRGSYSIDQQRYNFQFGGQTFWEIRNGKVEGMLRDVAYQSRTTDFWNSCDGIGGKDTYLLPGTFNDGKGEPSQSNAVSHGCPVARFRGLNVLNTAS